MPVTKSSSFGLDEALARRLRDMGAVLDPSVVAGTRALFADRIDLEMPAGGARHYDVAYGPDPRQKLDICATYGRGRPVVLFVPGGGFTGGDKSAYLHIPTFFARQGFVGVAMNYRLAPQNRWPDGARDVAAALDWLSDRIGDCGGDPERVFVVAQSAGAVHASAALFDPRLQPASLASVRAAVLMSGLYRIDPAVGSPGIAAYFGDDPATCAERSPLAAVGRTGFQIVLTRAELDPPSFARQFEAMAGRLSEVGCEPRTYLLEDHNHLSPVIGLGAPGDLLGPALMDEFSRLS